MADTAVLAGLELRKWRNRFIPEFTRQSGFAKYMGGSSMDIIHVKNDFKANGSEIRIPLVKRLQSAGVEGNNRLRGNEEAMDQYYQDVRWKTYRHAITVTEEDEGRSAVDLMSIREPLLREWAADLIKYQIIEKFHSINGTKFTQADQNARDAWVAANTDRVQFGAAVSNHSGNDHSAALANIDGADDKLTANLITLIKRRARMASPHIKPFKTMDGKEYYVLFAHPLCFRDLKQDTTMVQANREARARDVESNPIFQDGDLIYDGVIIREIPELYQPRFDTDTVNTDTHLAGVGASSIDVGANFLCGAQALAMVNRSAATPISEKDDYDFISGVGVKLQHGIEKMRWANGSGTTQDFGMMTVYAAAVADA